MLYLLCISSIIYMLDVLCLLIWGSVSFGFLFVRSLESQIWLKKRKSINIHQVCGDFNYFSLY